jgi:hypothetical protein
VVIKSKINCFISSHYTALFIVYSAVFFFLPLNSLLAQESSCVSCHTDYQDEMKASVHSRHDVTCHDCHGGDPSQDDQALAMSKEAGFLGVPDKLQIAEKCGSCHANVEVMNFYGVPTDQLARYKTSVHGKRLFNDNDMQVAVCSDCHGYHDILPIADPQSSVYPTNVPTTCTRCHDDEKRMAPYKLKTGIYKTYAASVHGQALLEKKDISAPNCASCHGSHGAVPPGVKDVSTTCGKCHVNEKKYFLESPHAEAAKAGKFSECVSCHGNHGVEHAKPALFEASCVKCHDAASSAARVGQDLKRAIKDAEAKYNNSSELVKMASIDGIFIEPEAAVLEEMKTKMIEMAPLQHTLSAVQIQKLNKNVTTLAQSVQSSVDEKRQSLKRRKFALIPIWILIFVMASALWIKYKQLHSIRKKDGKS